MDIEERLYQIEERMNNIEMDLSETVRCQRENTKNLGLLIKETEGLVRLQKNIQGTITIGASVQKFGLWLAKWPVVFAAFYAAIEYFKAK